MDHLEIDPNSVDRSHSVQRRIYRTFRGQIVKRPNQKSYKKRVEYDWSEEDSLKLIRAIETRPEIWDLGSEKYKLPKRIAWQEVARSISRNSISDCQGKWGNLRTTFKRKISENRGKNIADNVNIKWPYFKAMQFLELGEVRQQQEDAMPVGPMKMEPDFDDCSFSNGFETPMLEESAINEQIISSPYPPISPTHPNRSIPEWKNSPTQTHPNGTIPESSSTTTQPEKQSLRKMLVFAMERLSAIKQERDEFTIFGEWIASELRSLSADQARLAKRKIGRATNDALDEAFQMDLSLNMPQHQHNSEQR